MPDHYLHELAGELRRTLRENGKAAEQDLALPDDQHAGRDVGHQRMIQDVRLLSQQQPTCLARLLERLAPKGPTLPDGTVLRSETGLKNFHDLVKEARPDVYTAIVLTEHPPGQEPPTTTDLEKAQQAQQQAMLQAQQQAQMAQVQPQMAPPAQPAPGGF